ncbi:unnamed protein product, partial [marine sediment metagenome]
DEKEELRKRFEKLNIVRIIQLAILFIPGG